MAALGGGPPPPHARMRLRLVERPTYFHRAGDGHVRLLASRPHRDDRRVGVGTIALLDRTLESTKIHRVTLLPFLGATMSSGWHGNTGTAIIAVRHCPQRATERAE